MGERRATRKFRGRRTQDGAGVSLTRIFGFGNEEELDPFLLLDAFGSKDPREYLPGFPWHPHRGIETVTYLLKGSVRHGDSLGNSGVIGPGELQWMTAGSGIIHEEMPQESPEGVLGFQLWVNLPRTEKMKEPAYRGVLAGAVPRVGVPGGEISVLAGDFGGVRGPVEGVARDPAYFEARLEPGASLTLEAPPEETAFVYVFEGSLAEALPGGIAGGGDRAAVGDRASAGAAVGDRASAGDRAAVGDRARAEAGDCLLFTAPGEGDRVEILAGAAGARLIFARGRPLREPIAWRGPIVMNSEEELTLAFEEFRAGTFVKAKRSR